MFAAIGLLGRIPFWIWPVLAALAWGGWQRYSAMGMRAEFQAAETTAAEERARDIELQARETLRRFTRQQEINDGTSKKLARLPKLETSLADAGERLRAQLAAAEAQRCTGDPAAGRDLATATAAIDLRADVRRRLDQASDGVARFADEAHIRGTSCEQSYGTLTEKPGATSTQETKDRN